MTENFGIRSNTFSSVPLERIRDGLQSAGLFIDLGAIRLAVRSALPEFAELLRSVYPFATFLENGIAVDTSVQVVPARSLRRWIKPLARIEFDGIDPFSTFPRSQLLPNFEWGVNWAFAHMMNAHLILHSGTVAIDGMGVLLIAKPGSGKSTLTAGLIGKGARLLSDEFGVLRTTDCKLLAIPKPIALKNESIAVVQRWIPDARMGPVFPKTRKGDLAHMAAPASAFRRLHEPVSPEVIIFPRYVEGTRPSLSKVPPAQAFMELASNTFNYDILGAKGFESVAQLVERCAIYRFEYGNLQDAVDGVIQVCQSAAAAEGRLATA